MKIFHFVFGLLRQHGFRAHTLHPGAREHNSCPELKEMFTKRNTDHSKSLRPIDNPKKLCVLGLHWIIQTNYDERFRQGTVTFLSAGRESRESNFQIKPPSKIFSYRVGTCQRSFLSCKTILVWKISDANSYDFAMFIAYKFSVFFRLRQMIYWPAYIFLYKPPHCAGCFQFI